MTSTTIIIFSHNRHSLLRRSLEYYQSYSGPVIVVDSSSSPYLDLIPNNTTYHHCPSKFMGEKIYSGLKHVTTPYTVLSADDDFLSFRGLEAGERFLNNNLDHVSVQGHYINFDPTNSLSLSRPMYMHFNGHKNITSSIDDRMKKSLQVQHFYALFRSEVLKECLSTTLGLPQITLAEISTGLISMIRGKHQVIPVFWMARDIARYTSYNTQPLTETNSGNLIVLDWETYMQSNDGRRFMAQICSALAHEYKEENVREWVMLAIRHFFDLPIRKTTKFQIRDFVKSITPKKFVRMLQVKNARKLQHTCKSVPGYPWSEPEAMKEWQKIVSIIQFHQQYLKPIV